MKKKIALLMAMVMLFGMTVAGTLAWLQAETDPVVNTFTVGDINITLAETTGNNYKMIPGTTLPKDPKVTVLSGSEKCWVFIKVEESQLPDYIEYSLTTDWVKVDGVDNVYKYKNVVDAASANVPLQILADNQVKIADTVTKDTMSADLNKTMTLTFTAYAIQSEELEAGLTDAQIWALID